MPKDPTSEFSSPAATVVAGGIHPAAVVPERAGFFGHPRGLATLFFTEFWERFSFYGLRALLQLFMVTAAVKGGLGFSDPKAGAIYGLYTSFVYLTALPGGWLADRLLGQRRAVFVGGCIIALGHFSMAI
ncbi:MAG: proton-dependent oligopeptide transporter, family, partial [Acidobacteriota bacterium]|nr:proton-dependent oligopeptide transporter, family [Acidobacteriota bacterium]